MDGQATLTPDEVTEIERHKYFLSERAGHDVGWDFAERDWQTNFGSLRIDDAVSTVPACEAAVPPPHSKPVHEQTQAFAPTSRQASSPTQSNAQFQRPEQPESGSGLGGWLKRLLAKH